ncbi:unnamed protein product [Penicillium salamii]|nr:unnamed protein product [Penicillium salamii]CAG8176235.1 unnamed protein product [Penicillium salamii]CAG8368280.1 unnamed protein product [Penicillium salamii]
MASSGNHSEQKCQRLAEEAEESSSTSETPPKIPKLNLPECLGKHLQTTLRNSTGFSNGFSIVMDNTYSYKIGTHDFEPEDVFHEIVTFTDQLASWLKEHTDPEHKAELEECILNHLIAMVFGSNLIERAGSTATITHKLCSAVFRGGEIPQDRDEAKDFLELKDALLRKNLPADTKAILRSCREIIQHAKAASFIINQLCICDRGLTEDIILQTHQILTYKIDADDMPWEGYSGVYRTEAVSAGLHEFPHHTLVPYKMKSIIRELRSDLNQATRDGQIDPIATAAKYTHMFVNIHPFIDGNGRMCRLILNSLLLKLGSFIVPIGEDEEDRSLYLDVAANGSAAEDTYGDLDEDEKPTMHAELGSFIMSHLKGSMEKLMKALRK